MHCAVVMVLHDTVPFGKRLMQERTIINNGSDSQQILPLIAINTCNLEANNSFLETLVANMAKNCKHVGHVILCARTPYRCAWSFARSRKEIMIDDFY